MIRTQDLRRRAYVWVPITLLVIWITVSVGLAAGVYVFMVATGNAPPFWTAEMLADIALEMGAYAGWSPAIILTGMYELARWRSA